MAVTQAWFEKHVCGDSDHEFLVKYVLCRTRKDEVELAKRNWMSHDITHLDFLPDVSL